MECCISSKWSALSSPPATSCDLKPKMLSVLSEETTNTTFKYIYRSVPPYATFRLISAWLHHPNFPSFMKEMPWRPRVCRCGCWFSFFLEWFWSGFPLMAYLIGTLWPPVLGVTHWPLTSDGNDLQKYDWIANDLPGELWWWGWRFRRFIGTPPWITGTRRVITKITTTTNNHN